MMLRMSGLFVAALLFVSVGCEPAPPPKPESTCGLSMDGLAGKQFAMYEAMPDRTNRVNPSARGQFFEEGGQLKVRYNVKSLGDVYTYQCKKIRDGKEWFCAEEPKIQDWCQALEVHQEGSCTPEKLKELGAGDVPDEKIAAGITAAKEVVAKYRGQPTWKQFELNNNNLGNKLQGQLYASVNEKRCQLSVSDMYMTIYNGAKKEDSNPVGTNAFVELEGDWLWEHCDEGRSLVDSATPEKVAPELVPPANQRVHDLGKEIFYNWYGEAASKAEAGCTYSFDAYAQWQPVSKDNAVTVDGEMVKWTGSHTFTDVKPLELINPMQPLGVYTMVRYKSCNGGPKAKIDTICNVAKIMAP